MSRETEIEFLAGEVSSEGYPYVGTATVDVDKLAKVLSGEDFILTVKSGPFTKFITRNAILSVSGGIDEYLKEATQ